jgi:mannose-6-phosphate isomerase-like protein (cupin superfamily)
LSGGKADFRYLIDSYLDWAAGQRIPVVEDLCVDLDQVATAPWGRLGGGCRAAFLHLRGRGDFLALQLIEIPPGAQTDWARHLYDEVFYVLSGHGSASIETGAGDTHRCEWGPRALFSPPLNARYRLANLSASAPARLICGNDLPFLMNVFRSEAFLFDHPFAFAERVGRAGGFAGEGDFLPVAPGRHLWETSFIPDVAAFALPEGEARGAGNRNINVILSDSSMHAHVSEMPGGTYTKGRRHDAGVHVMAIAGAGYTLVWKEGDSAFERLELRPGTLFALTPDTLHQHFNPGAEPLRYLAISIGSDRYPMLARTLKRKQVFDASVKDGGLQIDYADQDPRIHALWRDAIAATGAASLMERHFGQPA